MHMIASSTLLGLACLITSTFAAALPVTTDLARGAEGKARNPDLVVRTQQDTYDHEDYQQDDQDNNDNQNDDYENNDHEDSNAQCGIALRLDWLTVNKHGNIFKISNKQLIVFKVDDENYSYLPTTPYTLNSQDDSYIPLKDGYRGIKVNASWSNNADQDHTGLTYAHMSIEGDNKQYNMMNDHQADGRSTTFCFIQEKVVETNKAFRKTVLAVCEFPCSYLEASH